MAPNTAPDPGPSPTRLRQIAFVAEDLQRAEELLTTVLGTEVIFVDPDVERWGLRNILVAIGGDVIEVVSPIKPGPSTTAGRLLAKRGDDGGYMIIMQTTDATARRASIEARGLARVIHAHEYETSVCIQYHPRDVKGGMMPELDSHTPTPANPRPLTSPFSPWHACGPHSDYASYSAGMRRCAHLSLRRAVCRLAADDRDEKGAARQWEDVFGVPRRSDDTLAFTNAEMVFEGGHGHGHGHEGEKEGLVSITIAVAGRDGVEGLLARARTMGVSCGWSHTGGEAWVDMLGIRWYFVAGPRESRM